MSNTNFDCEYTKKPTCPHCGYVEKDDWDMFTREVGLEFNVECDCNSCGEPMMVARMVTFWYTTRKTETGGWS